jgi:hypothetical protein
MEVGVSADIQAVQVSLFWVSVFGLAPSGEAEWPLNQPYPELQWERKLWAEKELVFLLAQPSPAFSSEAKILHPRPAGEEGPTPVWLHTPSRSSPGKGAARKEFPARTTGRTFHDHFGYQPYGYSGCNYPAKQLTATI